MNYETLTKDIIALRDGVVAFKKQYTAIANEVKAFSEYLANHHFSHSFPTIEKEVNDIIGQWQSDSFDLLKAQLDGHFNNLAFLDKEIDKIKALQLSLEKYPDRHDRKNLTDNINTFLQLATKISLSKLDNVCNKAIPEIHRRADLVINAFNQENDQVNKNKQSALELKKRIGKCEQYVDRFNLRQICAEGKKATEQVLQMPNVINPDIDEAKLKKAAQSLNQCLAKFNAENKLFNTIKHDMANNRECFWPDEYDELMIKLEKGAFYQKESASQLQAQYNSLLPIKDSDITDAVSVFSQKIQTFFSSDIGELRYSIHQKKDLFDLINRMNQKVAEDKKKLIIKILKYSGIVIAIGILLALIIIYVIPWVVENWLWLLLGAIVIGFIIIKFSK